MREIIVGQQGQARNALRIYGSLLDTMSLEQHQITLQGAQHRG